MVISLLRLWGMGFSMIIHSLRKGGWFLLQLLLRGSDRALQRSDSARQEAEAGPPDSAKKYET